MSTEVEEQVVYHAIEHLDFDPPCGLREQRWIKVFRLTIRFPEGPRCKRPVEWRGDLPCCDTYILTCAKHRRDNSLGMLHCGVRWIPLNLSWKRI